MTQRSQPERNTSPLAQRRAAPRKLRPPAERARKPLLIIDGDFFAHRAYHGLPKSIRRSDGGGGGAVVGFANFLLRFFANEHPRAVLVGWDTLDQPTYRHQAFAVLSERARNPRRAIDQLHLLASLSLPPAASPTPRRSGYEADDFVAAAVAAEERRGGTALVGKW